MRESKQCTLRISFYRVSNPDNLNDSLIIKCDKIKKEKSTAFSSDLEHTNVQFPKD